MTEYRLIDGYKPALIIPEFLVQLNMKTLVNKVVRR